MSRIIIACGGTGGHIYPGIAIARALKNSNNEIIFVGRKNSLEEKIFKKEGWKYETIISCGMPRNVSLKWFPFFFKTILGIIQSIKIIIKIKPDIIIATGAYISFPIILSGKLFAKPELILEQNVHPGVTIRIAGFFVDKIATSFKETENYLPKNKCQFTGNPVRQEIISKTKQEAIKILNLDINKKTILIFGGSQGASKINKASIKLIKLLESEKDKIQIIIITGEDDYSEVSEAFKNVKVTVKVFPFLFNMEDALGTADLVVSRSGATALAEINVLGIPAILVPYPYATDNHQLKNAKYLESTGAGYIFLDSELTGEKIYLKIKEFFFDEQKLQSMHLASLKLGRPNALDDIIKIVKELVGQ